MIPIKPPYIISFVPASGPPRTVIAVSGYHFRGINKAWVGNRRNGAIVTALGETELRIVVPENATTGIIAVHNSAGWAYSTAWFTVTQDATAASIGPGNFSPMAIGGGF